MADYVIKGGWRVGNRKKLCSVGIALIFFCSQLAINTQLYGMQPHVNLSPTAHFLEHRGSQCAQVSFFLFGWGMKVLFSYLSKQSIDKEFFAQDIQEDSLLPTVFTGVGGASNAAKCLSASLVEAFKIWLATQLAEGGISDQHVKLLMAAFGAGSSFTYVLGVLRAWSSLGQDLAGVLWQSALALPYLVGLRSGSMNSLASVQTSTCVAGEAVSVCAWRSIAHDMQDILSVQNNYIPYDQGTLRDCGPSNPLCLSQAEGMEKQITEKEICGNEFALALWQMLVQGSMIPIGAILSIMGLKVGSWLAQIIVKGALGLDQGASGSALELIATKGISRYSEVTFLTAVQDWLLDTLRQPVSFKNTTVPAIDLYSNKILLQDKEKILTPLLASALGTTIVRIIWPKKERIFLENVGLLEKDVALYDYLKKYIGTLLEQLPRLKRTI